MRESDRLTIEGGTPSTELMFRAAQGIYENVKDDHGWVGRIGIVIGSGNNGGDGAALACILAAKGHDVSLYSLYDNFSLDSRYYLDRAAEQGIILSHDLSFEAEILVDCILGTGFHGTPTGAAREMIEAINRIADANPECYIVSADINSGMNGDSGEYDIAVRSDLTVAIGCHKTGLLEALCRRTLSRRAPVRRISLAPIGIQPASREHFLLDEEEWRAMGFADCRGCGCVCRIKDGIRYYRL